MNADDRCGGEYLRQQRKDGKALRVRASRAEDAASRRDAPSAGSPDLTLLPQMLSPTAIICVHLRLLLLQLLTTSQQRKRIHGRPLPPCLRRSPAGDGEVQVR